MSDDGFEIKPKYNSLNYLGYNLNLSEQDIFFWTFCTFIRKFVIFGFSKATPSPSDENWKYLMVTPIWTVSNICKTADDPHSQITNVQWSRIKIIFVIDSKQHRNFVDWLKTGILLIDLKYMLINIIRMVFNDVVNTLKYATPLRIKLSFAV